MDAMAVSFLLTSIFSVIIAGPIHHSSRLPDTGLLPNKRPHGNKEYDKLSIRGYDAGRLLRGNSLVFVEPDREPVQDAPYTKISNFSKEKLKKPNPRAYHSFPRLETQMMTTGRILTYFQHGTRSSLKSVPIKISYETSRTFPTVQTATDSRMWIQQKRSAVASKLHTIRRLRKTSPTSDKVPANSLNFGRRPRTRTSSKYMSIKPTDATFFKKTLRKNSSDVPAGVIEDPRKNRKITTGNVLIFRTILKAMAGHSSGEVTNSNRVHKYDKSPSKLDKISMSVGETITKKLVVMTKKLIPSSETNSKAKSSVFGKRTTNSQRRHGISAPMPNQVKKLNSVHRTTTDNPYTVTKYKDRKFPLKLSRNKLRKFPPRGKRMSRPKAVKSRVKRYMYDTDYDWEYEYEYDYNDEKTDIEKFLDDWHRDGLRTLGFLTVGCCIFFTVCCACQTAVRSACNSCRANCQSCGDKVRCRDPTYRKFCKAAGPLGLKMSYSDYKKLKKNYMEYAQNKYGQEAPRI